jgi:hypothetical protein
MTRRSALAFTYLLTGVSRRGDRPNAFAKVLGRDHCDAVDPCKMGLTVLTADDGTATMMKKNEPGKSTRSE